MEEKLVSFETAKLAKKKGFKEDCTHRFYYQEYHSGNGKWMHDVVGKFDWNCSDNISIPAQSLLQKWLREKHGVHIHLYYLSEDKKWGWDCYDYKKGTDHILNVPGYSWQFNHQSYEDALEEGLKIGLNLIKNGKFKK